MQGVVSRLERAAHLVGRYLEHELGLTQAEAHVLARLAAGEASSPTALHRASGLTPSTLTSVLDRLAARGLVVRAPHPDDRRSLVVTLTAAGRNTAAEVVSVVARLEAAAAAAGGDAAAGFAATLAALEAEALR
jgi:DNA-binding MarR family transcriptional regulator